jgi:uncharacterized protein with HEPN domain
MLERSRTSLEDVLKSCRFIRTATAGRTLDDYEADEMLRLSVERSFEMIGEALLRVGHAEPELLAAISENRRIVGFRNRLVHGYDAIDNTIVWEIIGVWLPKLCKEVQDLLDGDRPPHRAEGGEEGR